MPWGLTRFHHSGQSTKISTAALWDLTLRPALDSFHHCPGRGSGRSIVGKDARSQKSARKSHVFKILTYKIFVMKILREILPLEVGKLLILDILHKRGEGGVG